MISSPLRCALGLLLAVSCVDDTPSRETPRPPPTDPGVAVVAPTQRSLVVSESARIDPSWPDALAMVALAERCEREHAQACWLLGAAYEAMGGEDGARARVLYRKACREGAQGCVEAARTHPDQAAQHLAQGCRQGSFAACRAWAQADGTSEAHVAEARSLGCRAGWLQACEERIADCGGTATRCIERARAAIQSEDFSRAQSLLRPLCDGDRSSGCEVLASAYAGDPDAARVALERACRAGRASACRRIAEDHAHDDTDRARFSRLADVLGRR